MLSDTKTQFWATEVVNFMNQNGGLGLWCLMPLSTIFELYHNGPDNTFQQDNKRLHTACVSMVFSVAFKKNI